MTSSTFSLRKRLLIWILSSIFLIWIVTALFVWFDAKNELIEVFEDLASNRMSLSKLSHEKDELLVNLLWGLIWPMLIGLPILAIIVSWIIIWSNRSLAKLSKAISSRSGNSLEPINIDEVPQELSPVLCELNILLKRIRQVLDQEKRFTSDAAHELRTPLAAIRAQADILRLQKNLDQGFTDNLLESCDRSSRVIDQLLALARLDAATNPFVKKRIMLSDFLKKQVAHSYHLIENKKQSIQLIEESNESVLVNPDLLAILFRNLLDNASKYSPVGGQINLAIKSEDREVLLVIEDSGCGLSQEQMSRLGERFYRANDLSSSGAGLGWSIVKKIADVCQLDIKISRSPKLGGLLVSVIFPKNSSQFQST